MLIDWFTVSAQIFNFLLLVGLLKHFLYDRLLHAIDAREQRVAARIAEAEEKNRKAEAQVETARIEREQVEKDREKILADAKQEAEREHRQMLQQARDSVRALETKWHEDLDREKSAFLDEVRVRAANEMLSIARRALADLANVDLQHCATEAFLEKIRSIDAGALNGEVTLRSGAEVSDVDRQRIENTFHQRFGDGLHLTFERAPQMSWGFELRSNGRRIGWNPESYVGSLEENLRQTLEHRAL